MMKAVRSDFPPGHRPQPPGQSGLPGRKEPRGRNRISTRRPPLALQLAKSVFGRPPREGFVPMRFFAEEDVQVYLGLPSHHLHGLLRFSGQTTSRKIVEAVFPRYREKELPFKERLAFAEDLEEEQKPWLVDVLSMVEKIRDDGWDTPPISVLNFPKPKGGPWICRAEHLSGQVPDGAHRVLAYTLLADEFPERPVRVRVLGIHPLLLAVMNGLTIALSFLIDPLGTPAFIKKRFKGSAHFGE